MSKIYGYDTNIYETSIGNIKYLNEEKYIEMLEDGNLYDYIKDLQKKAELTDHYKHLYSEVKKQKDDVVEYIKYQLSNLDFEKDEDMKAKMLGSMILVMLEDNRMLGEIE